jgi:RHS repeat-associated protein
MVATSTGYYQYFGGKLLKNATGYVNSDRLGSIGKFFPYGQERPSATTNGKEKFATYTRDAETGLDYAENRYHSSGDGRFLTPDPYSGSAKTVDPSSWNRYAYTGGDPVNRTDASGRAYACTGSGGVLDFCEWYNDGISVFGYGLDPSYGYDPATVIVIGGIAMSREEACSMYGHACPPPNRGCSPGYFWREGYGCDRELNGFAQKVIQGINKNNPGGFVSGAALIVGLEGATGIAASLVATAIGAEMSVGDVIVLGKNPLYKQLAEDLGADFFSIADDLWAALSDAERWALNKAFLDGAIANGSRITLASPAAGAVGFYARELEYLMSQGYRLVGNVLIPPGLP